MCAGDRGTQQRRDAAGGTGTLGRDELEEHMEHYLAQGMNRKDAMKQTAKDRGMQKREVYNYLEKIKE